MLSRMSSRELTEWAAYERVTGTLGPERDDALMALQSYYLASAAGAKRLRVDKLMPSWDRRKSMDWRHMKMVAEAMTRQYGGDVKPKEV